MLTLSEVTRSEYILFVFIASIGILQLVADHAQLKGLLFIRQTIPTHIFSIMAIVGSYWWFFQRDSRIDTIMRQTGLEGKQQFYCFCTAAFLALAFTLIVSSLIGMIKNRAGENDSCDVNGLDALKEKTYFEALKQSFKAKK